ncbi:MAG: EamA family transporter [Candidatus Sumerlaeia bacterium]
MPSPTPAQTSSRAATTAAVGSILLWCWSGVCFRMGAELMGDMAYLTGMTAVGSLTVIVLHAWGGKPIAPLLKLPPRVIFAGFWGVAFYTVILSMAFGMADPPDIGQINLLNYLWPIWLVLLSFFMLAEKANPLRTLAGALAGLAGVAIARGPKELAVVPTNLLPHAMALAGGVMWSLYCVLLRRWRVPEENGGTAFHFAVCAAMAALIAWWRGQWHALPPVSANMIFWILFGGIGPVGLGYHWWEIGMKRGNVHLISLLAYFIPIGSSALIGFFFRQALNPGLLIGAFLIAAGAWIAREKK